MQILNDRIATVLGALLVVAGLLAFSMSSPAVGLGGGTDPQTQPAKVTATAEESTVDAGESTKVTVNVVDGNGDPVANTDCTFSIVSQPGNDASVDPATGTTDADGNVTTTLNVGSTPGTVEVEADCGGVTAAVSVVAGSAAGANPPASLPAAGIGTADSSGGNMSTVIAAALSLAGIALLGTGFVARRQSRSIKN